MPQSNRKQRCTCNICVTTYGQHGQMIAVNKLTSHLVENKDKLFCTCEQCISEGQTNAQGDPIGVKKDSSTVSLHLREQALRIEREEQEDNELAEMVMSLTLSDGISDGTLREGGLNNSRMIPQSQPPEDLMEGLLDSVNKLYTSGGTDEPNFSTNPRPSTPDSSDTFAVSTDSMPIETLLSTPEKPQSNSDAQTQHTIKDLPSFKCDDHHDMPVDDRNEVAQTVMLLSIMCSVIFRFSRKATDFMLRSLRILVWCVYRNLPVAGEAEVMAKQRQRDLDNLLDSIPLDSRTVRSRYGLEGKCIVFAACPTCDFTYKPTDTLDPETPLYPSHCSHTPDPDGKVCGARLTKNRTVNGTVVVSPLKPFVYYSVLDHIASLISRKDLESVIDRSCDDLLERVHAEKQYQNKRSKVVNGVFDSEFLRKFKGPEGNGRLFIDRGSDMRLAFSLNFDSFNPEGNRERGAKNSCGLISMACLNLPIEIRYKPENLYIAGIVPGPHEPSLERLNHYMRPLIDDMETLWRPGVHFSRSGSSLNGRHAVAAIILAACDLPAGRKLAALASCNSKKHLCSVCYCAADDIFHSDLVFTRRDVSELRCAAERWRDATTRLERKKIFKTHGVRWSEMWRLPYWDPTQQLVVDSMHNLLEGLIQNHFRFILKLTSNDVSTPEVLPAFAFEFKEPETYVPVDDEDVRMADLNDLDVNEIGQVRQIQGLLTASFANGGWENLGRRLSKCYFKSLKFVCDDLQLKPAPLKTNGGKDRRPTRLQYVELLLRWRSDKPLQPDKSLYPSLRTHEVLQTIRLCIKNIKVPTWINSVPANFGDAREGSLKADEWRTLCTIYIPLALVVLWGEGSKHSDEAYEKRCRSVLDHTMKLVCAVNIACKRSSSDDLAQIYRSHMVDYVRDLRSIHPPARPKPNMHMSLHIYDFLLLFGPVHSWWCFPFERLIGALQKISTNGRSGQLEQTMLHSFISASKLRRWFARPDCPPAIAECRDLFNKLYGLSTSVDVLSTSDGVEITDVIHQDGRATAVPLDLRTVLHQDKALFQMRLTWEGIHYATYECHEGNSLVMFCNPTNDMSKHFPGRIKCIFQREKNFIAIIQRYIPAAQPNPFRNYIGFPAGIYREEVSPNYEEIEFRQIVGHFARLALPLGNVAVLDLSKDFSTT